jgi:CMP-N,N'-diacetyllegionaminic acid synthase
MAYSIAFAKKLRIDRIIVTTDSAHYRDIAFSYGAECPYLRGAEASTDTALDELILADLNENLPRLGIALPDLWVRLKPTSPLRSVQSTELPSPRSRMIRASTPCASSARRTHACR